MQKTWDINDPLALRVPPGLQLPPGPIVRFQSGGGSRRGSHRLGGVCQRATKLRYRDGLVLIKEPEWRLTGTLVHLGVSYHYAEKVAPKPSWFDANPELNAEMNRVGSGAPHCVRNALECIRAYKQWYVADPWLPVYVEEEFLATVGELDPGGPDSSLDDEIVSCQPDLIAEANGNWLVVDHKTASGEWGRERLPRWTEELAISYMWQMMVNVHIARLRLGTSKVTSAWVQRIKRNPPYDFDRQLMLFPPSVYAEVPRQIRRAVARERELWQALERGEKAPPNLAVCKGPYGLCDYVPLCYADSPEDLQSIRHHLFTTRE